jgi:hypothetical protein
MAKTLDDLQTLLTAHGFACEQMLDSILATKLPTENYKNPAGENSLEVYISFDRLNQCVAVETLKAFDLEKAEYREAMLRCLMTATARTPLLRPGLEPEGDIRLRVDCPCDSHGAHDGDVLKALLLLHSFADAWFTQITAAMHKGKFDATAVAHLNLARIATHLNEQKPSAEPDQNTKPSPAPTEPESGPSITKVIRAAHLSSRPGATPSRLKALWEFRRWLDERGGNPSDWN